MLLQDISRGLYVQAIDLDEQEGFCGSREPGVVISIRNKIKDALVEVLFPKQRHLTFMFAAEELNPAPEPAVKRNWCAPPVLQLV